MNRGTSDRSGAWMRSREAFDSPQPRANARRTYHRLTREERARIAAQRIARHAAVLAAARETYQPLPPPEAPYTPSPPPEAPYTPSPRWDALMAWSARIMAAVARNGVRGCTERDAERARGVVMHERGDFGWTVDGRRLKCGGRKKQ